MRMNWFERFISKWSFNTYHYAVIHSALRRDPTNIELREKVSEAFNNVFVWPTALCLVMWTIIFVLIAA